MAAMERVGRWGWLFLGILGGFLLTLGAVATFTTENGGGSAALTAIGGAMVIIPVWNVVSNWEREVTRSHHRAAKQFGQAERAQAEGDPDLAEQLHAEAEATMLATLPAKSRRPRRGIPEVEQKVTLEATISRMRRAAFKETLDRTEIVGWLRSADDTQRISALAVMEVRPDLRDLEPVFAAMETPHSPVEQHQALVVLHASLDDMGSVERDRLHELAIAQLDGASKQNKEVFTDILKRSRATPSAPATGGTARTEDEEPVAPTDRES
ncbi:hypothetical protein J4H86_09025 [Spiractinospora alimapuensis]|uniref:hypothetical protein n=1 Tax=Spiractinospora alimapuensis TaxID=2820884 RepID=UPI001F42AA2A|nr:hypothetical protein [Spiractinospora alimapuensis]QVQ53832.1 hypothetical protein J4H86_09025 [Spiractinospora alimapuensis]